MRSLRILSILCLVVLTSPFAFATDNAVRGYARRPNGVLVDLGGQSLKLEVCSEAIVHVVYSPTGKFSDRPDYLVVNLS